MPTFFFLFFLSRKIASAIWFWGSCVCKERRRNACNEYLNLGHEGFAWMFGCDARHHFETILFAFSTRGGVLPTQLHFFILQKYYYILGWHTHEKDLNRIQHHLWAGVGLDLLLSFQPNNEVGLLGLFFFWKSVILLRAYDMIHITLMSH